MDDWRSQLTLVDSDVKKKPEDIISYSEDEVIKKVYVERRPGDPASLIASNKKAKELLGWEPKYNLEKIMETAWKFHSTHKDGFKK